MGHGIDGAGLVVLAALLSAIGWALKRLIDRNDDNGRQRWEHVTSSIDALRSDVNADRLSNARLEVRVRTLERDRGRNVG